MRGYTFRAARAADGFEWWREETLRVYQCRYITCHARQILRDMKEIVLKVRGLSVRDVENVRGGITQLREIRSSVYEDLNQIQHEYLLLRGHAWLLANGFDARIEWAWNPRSYCTTLRKTIMKQAI